jgi:hypothetical protein
LHAEKYARLNKMLPVNDERNRKKYPAGQAPFQRLPSELLLDIFALCKDASFNYPLVFGQICVYFRDVVHTTPGLWTTVDVVFIEPGKKLLMVEAMKVWAVKASPFPMDLTITIPPSTSILPADTFFQEVVSPLKAQLKTMTLNIISVHLFALAHLPPGPTLPLLETVSINLPQSSHTLTRFINYHESSIDLSTCPRLSQFSINLSPDPAVVGVMASGIFALPHSQLTTLSISGTMRIVSRLLQQCTRLLHFRITLEDKDPWYQPPPSTELVHATLRQLELTSCHPVVKPFFLKFSFPALEDLTLRDTGFYTCGYSTKSMASILTAILKDAPFQLKRLRVELKGICRDPRYLFAPLTYTPHLTHLEFKNCGFLNHPGLQAFSNIICGTSSSHLNELESLSFGDQVVSVEYGKVLDVTNQCVDRGIQPRLMVLRVYFQIRQSNARDPTPMVEQRVRAMRIRGLNVELNVEYDTPAADSSDDDDGFSDA